MPRVIRGSERRGRRGCEHTKVLAEISQEQEVMRCDRCLCYAVCSTLKGYISQHFQICPCLPWAFGSREWKLSSLGWGWGVGGWGGIGQGGAVERDVVRFRVQSYFHPRGYHPHAITACTGRWEPSLCKRCIHCVQLNSNQTDIWTPTMCPTLLGFGDRNRIKHYPCSQGIHTPGEAIRQTHTTHTHTHTHTQTHNTQPRK